jgi:hypothetical protein
MTRESYRSTASTSRSSKFTKFSKCRCSWNINKVHTSLLIDRVSLSFFTMTDLSQTQVFDLISKKIVAMNRVILPLAGMSNTDERYLYAPSLVLKHAASFMYECMAMYSPIYDPKTNSVMAYSIDNEGNPIKEERFAEMCREWEKDHSDIIADIIDNTNAECKALAMQYGMQVGEVYTLLNSRLAKSSTSRT